MKTLITGAVGLLGKSLLETAPNNKKITATWFRNLHGIDSHNTWLNLDIRLERDVHTLFNDVKPDVIIHCAANGSVDWAETNYDDVFDINVNGVKYLIDAASDHNTKFVYISTNAVYAGDNPPYNELSPMLPVNAYGSIKMRAEQYVKNFAENWLIFRPFLLYGWPNRGARNNWVNSIIERVRSEKTLKLVDDIIWQPTYAPNCADAIWKLLDYDRQEFNIASPERATLYEFGLHVCDVFELDKNLLEPVSSDFFKSMAKRPKDTTYDLLKIAQAGIMLDDIKTGLKKMKELQ